MRVQSAATRDTLGVWRVLFVGFGLVDGLLCAVLLASPLAAAIFLALLAALAVTSTLLAPTFPRLMRLQARILAVACLVILLGILTRPW